MKTGLELCLHAAYEHGNNSESDHEVGDLQDMLTKAWGLMTPGQRLAMMADSQIREMIETEVPDIDYDDAFAGLVEEQQQVLAQSSATFGNGGSVYDQLVVEFPGFLDDTDVDGADLVDWVGRNVDLLQAAMPAVGQQDTDGDDEGDFENYSAPR